MPNLNKVMLMGNLTRDPELRYTANNTAVCKVGLAVNRTWYNKQTNERQEETTFVDCTAFAKVAELINQYMEKGRPLFIEGRLNLNQWKDQEGNNRSKLDVIIESFQFIDSRGGGGGGGGDSNSGSSSRGGSRGYSDGDDQVSSGYSRGGNGGDADGNRRPSDNEPGYDSHDPVPDDDIPF